MTLGRRAGQIVYWALPSLICLTVYWRGFQSWFRVDDLAWLGLGLKLRSYHDLLSTLFQPPARGTIGPWSEPSFFQAG